MKKSLTLLILTCGVIAAGVIATSQASFASELSESDYMQDTSISSNPNEAQEQKFVMSTISVEVENKVSDQEAQNQGDVYFVLLTENESIVMPDSCAPPNENGDECPTVDELIQRELVHLPGSCVLSGDECPAPEVVETPFDLNHLTTMTTLDWSPDGSKAVTIVTPWEETEWGMRQIPPSALYLYDAEKETWSKLFESQEDIIGQSFSTLWSPSGEWIAFKSSPVSGSENKSPNHDLHIIRPDGSDHEVIYTNPVHLFSWGGEKLFVMELENLEDNQNVKRFIRTIDPTNKEIETLFAPEKFKLFIPSPDGKMIASAEWHLQANPTATKEMTLLDLSGNVIKSLGTYSNQDGNIYPVAWSLDSKFVAYNNTERVYVSEINGDPTQVYVADNSIVDPRIDSVIFSPDNQKLLLEVFDGSVKFVITTLNGSENHTITWSGQDEHYEQIYQPSWRPPTDS